jgi:catechol 2,3-dioxygenase-like lactoylglutathione lyase family enzyme
MPPGRLAGGMNIPLPLVIFAAYHGASRIPARPRSTMPLDQIVTFLLTQAPDASLTFYRDTLGLAFLRDDGFALVFQSGAVTLRIGKVPSHTPQQHTVLGWEVEDLAASVAELSARGVAFERYPNMGQDEQGIATFPNGDKVAWFKDPDGNVLSLSQHA